MDIGDLGFAEEVVDEHIIRHFDLDMDEDQLYWHKDKNDRLILVVDGDEWKIQIDNQLPVTLYKDMIYPVPKETFHRLIKGSSKLVLKIKEL